MMRAARWSDNDHYFGPFTFALSDSYRTLAVCLRSSDDEDRATTFRVSIGRCSFLAVLPGWVIRPERKKVYPKWDEATIARLGRDWYWDITPREYSVGVFDGYLSVQYGRVTHDSSTEQRWGYFLPWTQWRHISNRLYGADGALVADVATMGWEEHRKVTYALSKVRFAIYDFDGEQIEATTYIEDRTWRRGTGLFRWLGYVWPIKYRRSLDISFDKETGPEKGSWKGGTMGTGIEMLPGEDHETAFRRYCDEEHRSKYRKYAVTFISRVRPLTEGDRT